jgi:hypothetical protein
MTSVDLRTALAAQAKVRLLADTGFNALIGKDVGSDLTHGDAYPQQTYPDGWVFIGVGGDGRPVRDPTGTGTSAVTLDTYGAPWGSPNQHNTAEFPVLRVIVWSDPTRPIGDPGMIAVRDAEDRCNRVRRVIRAVLNDPGNEHHDWGAGVVVTSCLLGTEVALRDVAPYDGVVAGELRFNVEI